MAIRSRVETITPQKAENYLNGGVNGNRHITKARVRQYARDMMDGNWQTNGSALVLDDNGHILDGQHRLQACVQARVSFETLVVRGIPPEAFVTLDTGKTRSVADLISIERSEGSRYATVTAAALYLMFHYERGSFSNLSAMRNVHAPPHVILTETYPKWGDASLQAAETALGDFRQWIGVAPPGVALFCHMMFRSQRGCKQKADAFIIQLRDGIDLGAESPVLWLRNRMRRMYHGHQTLGGVRFARNTRVEICAAFFHAWKHYRDDYTIEGRWTWRPGEDFPSLDWEEGE